MLSDMLWAGSFQNLIITSGGRRANPTRNVHADGEVMSRKRPAPHTARIQNKAIVAFKYLGCIVAVYGLSPDCDVPECTPALQLLREAACALSQPSFSLTTSETAWGRGRLRCVPRAVLGEPLLAHPAEICGTPAPRHSTTEAPDRGRGDQNGEDYYHVNMPQARARDV